jgi:hypothetical protein
LLIYFTTPSAGLFIVSSHFMTLAFFRRRIANATHRCSPTYALLLRIHYIKAVNTISVTADWLLLICYWLLLLAICLLFSLLSHRYCHCLPAIVAATPRLLLSRYYHELLPAMEPFVIILLSHCFGLICYHITLLLVNCELSYCYIAIGYSSIAIAIAIILLFICHYTAFIDTLIITIMTIDCYYISNAIVLHCLTLYCYCLLHCHC